MGSSVTETPRLENGTAGDYAHAWRSLTDRLDQRVDYFVERILESIGERPSYRDLDPDEVRPSLRTSVERVLSHFRQGGRPLTEADQAFLRGMAKRRALRGVTLDDLVHLWRFRIELFREQAYRLAPQGPHRESVLLKFMESTEEFDRGGMLELAAGYRHAQFEALSRDHRRRGELVRLFLFPGAAPAEVRSTAETYGFDPASTFHAVRARPAGDTESRRVDQLLTSGTRNGRPTAMLGRIGGDLCGFVAHLPVGTVRATIGVSPPRPLFELPEAFRLATRALETALAVGREGVVDMASLGVHPAVLADADVGDALVARYVAPLARLPSGAAILDTVEALLENDGRLVPTARELHVHVNTVRYRVARFEEMTGGSVRDTESLVEICWALRRHRLLSTSGRR